MPQPRFARPARPWAAVAVLGLHALGLVTGLWLAAGDLDADANLAQPPLIVTLLRPPRPQPADPPARRTTPTAPARPLIAPTPLAPEPAAPAAAPPQAIHLPAPAPVPASAPPLNLTLPRAASPAWSPRQPALDDPRANTAPRTVESRISASMGGDDREVVENLGDGKKRVRKGSHCTIVQRAREADLDPTMQSFRPSPALQGKC